MSDPRRYLGRRIFLGLTILYYAHLLLLFLVVPVSRFLLCTFFCVQNLKAFLGVFCGRYSSLFTPPHNYRRVSPLVR
jgi:hypothetical protein